jgi:hypothetical protein
MPIRAGTNRLPHRIPAKVDRGGHADRRVGRSRAVGVSDSIVVRDRRIYGKRADLEIRVQRDAEGRD